MQVIRLPLRLAVAVPHPSAMIPRPAIAFESARPDPPTEPFEGRCVRDRRGLGFHLVTQSAREPR